MEANTLDTPIGLTGRLLIGSTATTGGEAGAKAIDPSTGQELAPAYGAATPADIERACALAAAAFDTYRETPLEARAKFLEKIADNILAIGDALIVRAMQESGLARARLEGERGRSMNQLRLFAEVVREGSWLEARIDPAMPDRKPLPCPDLRVRNVPLGPVVVFGASNFPLAFSVAGGDTASALAAGCPVIVKAHHAHPGTSELVGRAVQAAVKECGMPEGTFALLYGSGSKLGTALVADPRMKAVGFTGSRGGGQALMRVANARPEPIPVYAEMSSINPVLVLPAALANRGEAIAKAFIASLTLGAGQFCTNPGLLLGAEGAALDGFVGNVAASLAAAPSQTMLTPGIHKAYGAGVDRLANHASVKTVARGQPSAGPHAGQAAFFSTDASSFIADHALRDEVFGSSSVLVRCPDVDTMRQILESLEGQLTITLQMDEADLPHAKRLLPVLERKAGRLLVNGFPTGVEVTHAMVHGGPFPSTADGRTTSVGSLAIYRFLRPVCYQDFPAALLPQALHDGNPLGIASRVNGKLARS